jgi:heme/copper-type cytochrome/quinol oxidase subunit 1
VFVEAFSYVVYVVYVLLFLAGLIFIVVALRTRDSGPRVARIAFLIVGGVFILIPVGLILVAELGPGA